MTNKDRREHLEADVKALHDEIQREADLQGADEHQLQILGCAARALWHCEMLRGWIKEPVIEGGAHGRNAER